MQKTRRTGSHPLYTLKFRHFLNHYDGLEREITI